MELKIKEEELGDLKERSKEFLKYERIYNFNIVFCIIWFFLPVFIGESLAHLNITEIELLLLLGLVSSVGSVLIPLKKKKEYKVKDIEWAKLYSYAIHNSLIDYLNTNSPGIKKKNRQFAVDYAQSLSDAVGERWEVGDFSLVESHLKAVMDFKKNLRDRVVPTLQSGDDEKLRRVRDLMYNLFYRSGKLRIEDLETVNKEMSTKDGPHFLKSNESGKITYHRILGLIKDKRIKPYLIPLAISVIVAGVVFLILVSQYGPSLAVVSVTIVLFGGLLAFLRPTKRGQGD